MLLAVTQVAAEGEHDRLELAASDPSALKALGPGQSMAAKVVFKDGRRTSLKFAVAPPRPAVELIGRSLQLAEQASPIALRLNDPDGARDAVRAAFNMARLESRPVVLSAQFDMQEREVEIEGEYVSSKAMLAVEPRIAPDRSTSRRRRISRKSPSFDSK